MGQGVVWAATGDRLWRRISDGTWSVEDLPGGPSVVTTVVSDAVALWACGSGVHRRAGGTWTALTPPADVVTAAAVFGGDLVVGLRSGAVVRYGGAAVIPMSAGMVSGESPNSLAVVDGSESALTLSVQLYDAGTGAAAGSSLSITLQPGDWYQWSRILDLTGATAATAKAIAVVTRTSGDDTWLAYGILNDTVTSDGTYVRMIPAEEY